MSQIIEEVKNDLGEEFQHKKAEITIGNMCNVSIIRFQFRQLLYNLFSNAVKFLKVGSAPHVLIDSKISEGKFLKNKNLLPNHYYCRISMSDNGIGIGLAIVKKIVENHAGHITAKGRIKRGATFDIYIPVIQTSL